MTVWDGTGDIPICDLVPHVLHSAGDQSSDGAFIAHARTSVPALVAEVRALRAVFGDRMQDEPALAMAFQRGAEAMRRLCMKQLAGLLLAGGVGEEQLGLMDDLLLKVPLPDASE